MNMKHNRIVGVLIGLWILPLPVIAQAAMGDVAIRSTPSGALAILEGAEVTNTAVAASGVTPARFRQLLIGDYKLTVRMYGYETYRTHVLLDPTKQIELDVRLSPKTRFKAGLRSLVFPGWGQWYSNQPTKGLVFTTLAVGSGLVFLLAETDYRDKRDGYRDLVDEFDDAETLDEQRRILPLLTAAQEEAYDAETVRQFTAGALVGVWALNVLDAIILFPERRGTVSAKGLTIGPSIDLGLPGLTISTSF